MEDKQQQKNTNDFFALLTQEDRPSSSSVDSSNASKDDYVVFRDADGSMKMLHNGKVVPMPDDLKDTGSAVDSVDKPVPEKSNQKVMPKPIVDLEKKKKSQHTARNTTDILPHSKSTYGVDALVADRTSEHEHAIKSVIKNAKVFFADRSLEQRFRNVLLTRLKGVRDSVDFVETLKRPVAQGGLGFDGQTVDRVQAALRPYVKQYIDTDHGAGALGEDIPRLVFQPQQSAERAKNQTDKQPADSQQSIDPLAHVDTQKAKVISDSILQSTPVQKQDIASQPKQSAPSQSKPKVQDITFTPQTVGPVEELERLTLKDFRRLGDSPERMISRLKEKIELLEDESFAKKIAGIKAWRHSDVYELYVDIGDQSIAEKKSIAEIIDQRLATQEQTLTYDEFEAVSDFNQWLRH